VHRFYKAKRTSKEHAALTELLLLKTIDRLGAEGAGEKEKLRQLSDGDVVKAFGLLLGKWESAWAWDTEGTSQQKSKALIARYMNRMNLGHHLKAADQVSASNAKLDRALTAVFDRVQEKLGPRM